MVVIVLASSTRMLFLVPGTAAIVLSIDLAVCIFVARFYDEIVVSILHNANTFSHCSFAIMVYSCRSLIFKILYYRCYHMATHATLPLVGAFRPRPLEVDTDSIIIRVLID